MEIAVPKKMFFARARVENVEDKVFFNAKQQDDGFELLITSYDVSEEKARLKLLTVVGNLQEEFKFLCRDIENYKENNGNDQG